MSRDLKIEELRIPLRDNLNKFHGELLTQLEKLEKYKASRVVRSDSSEKLKKEILTKTQNINILKNRIQRIKSENESRRQNIINFKRFVEERENSIKNIEIIESTISNNVNKKATLSERRANHTRFKLMYDFKIKCLFQSVYAIFFNQGTADIKRSLQLVKKQDSSQIHPKSLEQFNTAIGYMILILITVGKIIRINYSSMYKFFGSRSSLMIKDKTRQALICSVEGKMADLSRAKPFLECLTLDAVRVLENFKVSIKKIHSILKELDLNGIVDCLKSVLFKKMFVETQGAYFLQLPKSNDSPMHSSPLDASSPADILQPKDSTVEYLLE